MRSPLEQLGVELIRLAMWDALDAIQSAHFLSGKGCVRQVGARQEEGNKMKTENVCVGGCGVGGYGAHGQMGEPAEEWEMCMGMRAGGKGTIKEFGN